MAEQKSGYSSAQIAAMQRDAMRRVNEMRKLSEQKIAATPPPKIEREPAAVHTEEEQAEQKDSLHSEEPMVHKNILAGFLDKLNLDQETILILLLMFMLINEGGDNMLILALVYILL